MQVEKGNKTFVGYEYKKITVNKNAVSMYLDCYKNFGWFIDENVADESGKSQISIQMK